MGDVSVVKEQRMPFRVADPEPTAPPTGPAQTSPELANARAFAARQGEHAADIAEAAKVEAEEPEWALLDTAPLDGTAVRVTDDPVTRPLGAIVQWRNRRVNKMVGKSRQWVPEMAWMSVQTRMVLPFEPIFWRAVTREMWW